MGLVAKGQSTPAAMWICPVVIKSETPFAALEPVEQRLDAKSASGYLRQMNFWRKRKGDRFINGILTGSHQILSGALNDAG